LLNALLGAELLPTSVLPLTSVVTVIKWAPRPEIHISFASGGQESHQLEDAAQVCRLLMQYGTEKGNQEGVHSIQVGWPEEILRSLILLDTPGIGSNFARNTQSTMAMLPQVDAALLVLSVDPPPTAAEMAFYEQVWRETPHRLLALNKVDLVSLEERQELQEFLEKTLEAPDRFFCLSARSGEGVGQLREYFARDLAPQRTAVLMRAVREKALRRLRQTRSRLRLMQTAAQLPMADLDSRLVTLTESLSGMELSLDLLRGEQRRIHEWLELQVEGIRQRARDHFSPLSACPSAAQIADLFEPEAHKLELALTQTIADSSAGVSSRLQEIHTAVERSASSLFHLTEFTLSAPPVTDKFELPPFTTHYEEASLQVVAAGVVDHLVSRKVRQERRLNRLREWVRNIVVRNAELIRWSCFRAVDESFLAFRATLQKHLQTLRDETLGVIKRMRAKRVEDEALCQRESAHLDEVLAGLAEVEEALLAGAGTSNSVGKATSLIHRDEE
jgi:hypothetical protein